MNNVCLVGRLTRDPELRHTGNGTPVCNYTLAVDRQFKSEGQPTADFIPVQVWRQTAEFVAN
jgi:single-strand DNA-binding protein